MKAVQLQGEIGTAVVKKAMEMQKADGAQVLQLLDKALNVGQKVNLLA